MCAVPACQHGWHGPAWYIIVQLCLFVFTCPPSNYRTNQDEVEFGQLLLWHRKYDSSFFLEHLACFRARGYSPHVPFIFKRHGSWLNNSLFLLPLFFLPFFFLFFFSPFPGVAVGEHPRLNTSQPMTMVGGEIDVAARYLVSMLSGSSQVVSTYVSVKI